MCKQGRIAYVHRTNHRAINDVAYVYYVKLHDDVTRSGASRRLNYQRLWSPAFSCHWACFRLRYKLIHYDHDMVKTHLDSEAWAIVWWRQTKRQCTCNRLQDYGVRDSASRSHQQRGRRSIWALLQQLIKITVPQIIRLDYPYSFAITATFKCCRSTMIGPTHSRWYRCTRRASPSSHVVCNPYWYKDAQRKANGHKLQKKWART